MTLFCLVCREEYPKGEMVDTPAGFVCRSCSKKAKR